MKKLFIVLFLLFLLGKGSAQTAMLQQGYAMESYKIRGNHFYKRNLSFSEYHTKHFRRTIGSLISLRPISIVNSIAKVKGIPIYHKDTYRSKDVFSFTMCRNGNSISRTECKFLFRKKEVFHLFSEQDSSFYGAANTDILYARIQLGSDTSYWEMKATNLNGSRPYPQQGTIQRSDAIIHFEKATLLLPDATDGPEEVRRLLVAGNLVYAFTWQNEIVAAVSLKKAKRKIWLKEGLDDTLQDVIVNACAVLTFKRNLYR